MKLEKKKKKAESWLYRTLNPPAQGTWTFILWTVKSQWKFLEKGAVFPFESTDHQLETKLTIKKNEHVKRHSSTMSKFPLVVRERQVETTWRDQFELTRFPEIKKSDNTLSQPHWPRMYCWWEWSLWSGSGGIHQKYECTHPLGNNSSSRVLSYPYTQICAKRCVCRFALQHCNSKDEELNVHQDRAGSVNDRTSTPGVLGSYQNEEGVHVQRMKWSPKFEVFLKNKVQKYHLSFFF